MKSLHSLAGFTLEKILQDALRKKLSILPTAEFPCRNGKGPRLLDSGEGVTMPDYQAFGKSLCGWIDSKAKSRANYFQNLNRMEHGFDLGVWGAYIEIQHRTGMPVYIFVLESKSGGIFAASVNILLSSGNPREGQWNDGKASINFDKKAFTFVGTWRVPDGDLRNTVMNIQWDKVETIINQDSLAMSEDE